MVVSGEPLLELRGLGKSYGNRLALVGVDLAVAAGEIVCVLGPNGAGKSTLFSALLSRARPERGQILFRSHLVRTLDERRSYLSRTAHVGHLPGLFLDLSAWENLSFFGALFGKPSPGRMERLLKLAGLDGRMHERTRGFSRGMLQKLALCRAMLHEPDLILLDEPLTGLDPSGVSFLRELLISVRRPESAAMIVTHAETELLDLADRLVFLKDGRLVADIPAERYTAKAREHLEGLLYG